MQEGTPFCKMSPLQKSGFFVDFGTVPKGRQWHSALLSGFCPSDLPRFPPLIDTVEVLRQGAGRSAKTHTFAFRRRNTLSLSLPDVGALVLRHKGKHLQHNVAQEGAHQVFAAPGVQQWHIQHHDVSALCLGEQPPLL